jgi:ferredoxin
MSRIKIDRSRCAGHARCAAVAPALFTLDSEGYIATEGFKVPQGEEALAKRAARACPERIIAMEEDGGARQAEGPQAADERPPG